jgi:hypothetical protein
MKKRWTAVAIWVLWAGLASAQAGKPGDMYLELISATKKATSFDQIAPYMSADMLKEMKAAPAEARAAFFKGMKDTLNLTDVKFTSEKVSGDKCILEATAKNAAGKTGTGKIELVREKGAWKFSDHGWVTPI